MEDEEADNRDKLRASEIVMDRAWGKSTQTMDVSSNMVIFKGEKDLED